jgi:hypothetical protein
MVCFGPAWNFESSKPATVVVIMEMCALFPLLLMAPYALFRLFFARSLSEYPRASFGLDGTRSEFISAVFIALIPGFLSSSVLILALSLEGISQVGRMR